MVTARPPRANAPTFRPQPTADGLPTIGFRLNVYPIWWHPGTTARQHGCVRHRVVESQARDFLAGKYGPVGELRPLGGGAWSAAYSFSHAGHALVVRFGPSKEWFEADRAAVSFSSPELPVPRVLEVGDAFDGAYAV